MHTVQSNVTTLPKWIAWVIGPKIRITLSNKKNEANLALWFSQSLSRLSGPYQELARWTWALWSSPSLLHGLLTRIFYVLLIYVWNMI